MAALLDDAGNLIVDETDHRRGSGPCLDQILSQRKAGGQVNLQDIGIKKVGRWGVAGDRRSIAGGEAAGGWSRRAVWAGIRRSLLGPAMYGEADRSPKPALPDSPTLPPKTGAHLYFQKPSFSIGQPNRRLQLQ
jgi:hypothetical protein